MHNFQVSNDETDPKIRMYAKNRVGQTLFENFDFLVKIKGPLGQSFFFTPLFFFFFFFFFQAVRTKSLIRVELKEPGQAESGKRRHYDVIELEGRM